MDSEPFALRFQKRAGALMADGRRTLATSAAP
jgi:hypothetical protein